MSEISVCIPTYEYNGEGVKYLDELFESLSTQTFQDFDVVISDHSQDELIINYCRDTEYNFEITYIQNSNGFQQDCGGLLAAAQAAAPGQQITRGRDQEPDIDGPGSM